MRNVVFSTLTAALVATAPLAAHAQGLTAEFFGMPSADINTCLVRLWSTPEHNIVNLFLNPAIPVSGALTVFPNGGFTPNPALPFQASGPDDKGNFSLQMQGLFVHTEPSAPTTPVTIPATAIATVTAVGAPSTMYTAVAEIDIEDFNGSALASGACTGFVVR